MMSSKYDETLGQAEHAKRTATLLDDELRQIKTKLSRVTQDKIKMERDQRVTMSLAKSLESNPSSVDTEYYKRKTQQLTSQVQGLNASIAEKDRQLKETRRQLERNMSQNRLANLKADSTSTARSRRS
jgi:outer membrane murein-binding lipoprotein Lpp